MGNFIDWPNVGHDNVTKTTANNILKFEMLIVASGRFATLDMPPINIPHH
jgi:hypothetical protein